MGAAHGALWGPAARRMIAGNWVTRVCHIKKSREVNQFGENRRVNQDGAVIRASVIMGITRMGGSNWSNSLRFIVIQVLVGQAYCFGLGGFLPVEVEGKWLWLGLCREGVIL